MGQARDVLDKMTVALTEERDLNSVVDIYADDAVVTTPDAGEIRGHDQIAEYWREFVDGFSDSAYEPISKIETENKAVDEGFFVGTNTGPLKSPEGETLKPTGKKVKIRSCDVATVQDGKITEHHLYFDQADFMGQLGLAE